MRVTFHKRPDSRELFGKRKESMARVTGTIASDFIHRRLSSLGDYSEIERKSHAGLGGPFLFGGKTNPEGGGEQNEVHGFPCEGSKTRKNVFEKTEKRTTSWYWGETASSAVARPAEVGASRERKVTALGIGRQPWDSREIRPSIGYS